MPRKAKPVPEKPTLTPPPPPPPAPPVDMAEGERLRAMIARLKQEKQARQSVNRLAGYRPYAKQREFHDAGKAFRERGFMAGNQLGKTLAGSAEAAMHLTGRYPDWWQGR